jgi:predicted ferric reductase
MDMGYPYIAELNGLPLSDPRCRNESCMAYLDAENASQAAIPWASLFDYGHWLTYYWVIILGLLTIVRLVQLFQDRRAPLKTTSAPSTLEKLRAALRFISYRRFTWKPLQILGLPSFGMLAFLLTGVVFVAALTFAAKPYYREHLGYGSPPIAIRSGLMAFACVPILIALAGKANIITLLTGISHERLNVVHQWVAWISFILSLFHTIPYFLQSAWDAPFYGRSITENVKLQFYVYGTIGGTEVSYLIAWILTNLLKYSGVPPLAILFAICVLSLPFVRTRFYESFYFTHILMGVTYLGLLFWHAGNLLDSWAYLWATLALWLASSVARAFWYTRPLNIRQQWLIGASTTIQTLPGGMTLVEVNTPDSFIATPSQHCFLRFPRISPLDNHPFTMITSSTTPQSRTPINDSKNDLEIQETTEKTIPATLSFLVRTHSGFTRRLEQFCSMEGEHRLSAWIDGPYGGVSRPVEKLYDTLILVAGGSGVSACLSWLLDITSRHQDESRASLRVNRIVFIWIMRDTQHFAWGEQFLKKALSTPGISSDINIDLKFFVTREESSVKTAFDTDTSSTENELSAGKGFDKENGNSVLSINSSSSSPLHLAETMRRMRRHSFLAVDQLVLGMTLRMHALIYKLGRSAASCRRSLCI